jgi:hypothetical protein
VWPAALLAAFALALRGPAERSAAARWLAGSHANIRGGDAAPTGDWRVVFEAVN